MFRDRNNSRVETEPTAKDHEDLLPPAEPEAELPGETMQSQPESKETQPSAGEGDPRDQEPHQVGALLVCGRLVGQAEVAQEHRQRHQGSRSRPASFARSRPALP